MRFRRGGGREKKREWRWMGKRIEEAKEVKYLGYVLQRNGGQKAQVRDRGMKAAAIMGQVWGIGKRRFGKDWSRRLWLFDRLVWTVMGYGVEIWEWKEREVGEDGRKVFEMGIGGRRKDTLMITLHDKRGAPEGQTVHQSGEKGMGL